MSEPVLPLIAEPDALEHELGGKDLLVVDLGDEATHARHHVPGAVHLPYGRVIDAKPPSLTELPVPASFGTRP